MKNIFLGIVFFVCLFCVSNAQQNQVEQIVNANLDASEFSEQSAAIQYVDVSFCGKYGEKSIDYEISSGRPYKICINLFNGSSESVIVNLGFVDGMLTNDQWKNRACGLNDDVDAFGKYVTDYQNQITLSSGESKTYYAKLFLPKELDLTGSKIEGCLVYSLISNNSGGDSAGFDIVVRRAKFINLNIKKVPAFDFRYLGILFVLIVFFLILRMLKASKTSKGK